MIKSVIVTNHLGEEIELELMRPELSGFLVKSITGLGPVKSDINMTDIATFDGGLFNSARLGTRNIVMDLIFINNRGETIEDVRRRSYRYFSTKTEVTVQIVTDIRTYETHGRIESNEPDIFNKQSGCKISIICPFSYFYGVGEDNKYVFSGVEPLFEFPFSNESLEEPLIEMGSIKIVYEGLLIYDGDAETGVKITLHANDEVEMITIYNIKTRETMEIDTEKLAYLTGSGIVARDEIIINTVKGDKYIWLLREGQYINILNCVNKDADWFQLSAGDNLFAFDAVSGKENLMFTIENRVIYKGV